MMMTPAESFKLRSLMSNLINATISGEPNSRQIAHEDHLRNYVTGLLEEKEAEIAAWKARDARFIQYCDSLSAMLLDLVEYHRANSTASVIVKIQEEHGIDLAPIFNPEIQWYRFTSQDQILEKWLNAYISEGLAADLLGVGRIQARMMMENKYGMDWRSAREIFVEEREEEESKGES